MAPLGDPVDDADATDRSDRRRTGRPASRTPDSSGGGPALAFAVLLLQDPMFRNHLSRARRPGRAARRAVPTAVAVVAVAGAGHARRSRPSTSDRCCSRATTRAATPRIVVGAARTPPPSAWALSDDPGLVWRAGLRHRSVASSTRRCCDSTATCDAIKITEDRVVERRESSRRVCAVAVTAPVRFGRYADLPDRLAALGYRRTVDLGDRFGPLRAHRVQRVTERSSAGAHAVSAWDVVALVVRLPAFFAPQPLGFDDGQFAMSVIAMRHGGLPFREVFSSQGPLFLPDRLARRSPHLPQPRLAADRGGDRRSGR